MIEERETATHHAVEIGAGSPCCGHLNGMVVACVTCRSNSPVPPLALRGACLPLRYGEEGGPAILMVLATVMSTHIRR
jgi:hypothetical protein